MRPVRVTEHGFARWCEAWGPTSRRHVASILGRAIERSCLLRCGSGDWYLTIHRGEEVHDCIVALDGEAWVLVTVMQARPGARTG